MTRSGAWARRPQSGYNSAARFGCRRRQGGFETRPYVRRAQSGLGQGVATLRGFARTDVALDPVSRDPLF